MSGNLARSLIPFVFDYVKDLLFEEFSEIVSGDTDVNVIVDLHGHTDAIALSDAEASGKHDLVLDVMLLNGALKQLHDFLRAAKVAGGADANLNEYHGLYLGKHFGVEEIGNGIGGNGEEGVVDGNANTLLALAHAEGSAEIYLVADVVFGDQLLELLDDLARALDVAGASDTNSDFKHNSLPLLCYVELSWFWGRAAKAFAFAADERGRAVIILNC